MARLQFNFRLEADPADVRAGLRYADAFIQMAYPGQRQVRPVADSVREGIAFNFSNQSSGSGSPWPALHRRTVRERRALGFPPHNPILRRTGSYMSSFTRRYNSQHSEEYWTTNTGWRLAIGSNDRRVRILEGGRGSAPARPATILGAYSEQRIGAALDTLYTRLFSWAEGLVPTGAYGQTRILPGDFPNP